MKTTYELQSKVRTSDEWFTIGESKSLDALMEQLEWNLRDDVECGLVNDFEYRIQGNN